MDSVIRTVAAVTGAPGGTVQHLFRALVDRWRPVLRLAGVVAESHGLADRVCGAGYLCRIGTLQRFAMFEDRGRGAATCHLDGKGALSASEAVQQDIAKGCDLVVLSKFGRLEAAGKGLWGAFNAVMEGSIPLLTSVSPSVAEEWKRFAAPGFATLQADAAEIDAWVKAVLPSALYAEARGLVGAGANQPGSRIHPVPVRRL